MWFCISVSCMKWNGYVSHFFNLTADVRQGGVLSSLFFAIFVDQLADKVKTVNAGCYNTVCCSIFLYAYDILLIAPTISGLQALWTACEKELIDIDMCINLDLFVLARDFRCPAQTSSLLLVVAPNRLAVVVTLVCSLSAVERWDAILTS